MSDQYDPNMVPAATNPINPLTGSNIQPNPGAAFWSGVANNATLGGYGLIQHLANPQAWQKLQDENPQSFSTGGGVGDVASLALPLEKLGLGLNVLEKVPFIGGAAKGVGDWIANTGAKNTLGNSIKSGAVNSSLATGISDTTHNITDPNDQRDVGADLAGSALLGGAAGGALHGIANLGNALNGAESMANKTYLANTLGVTSQDFAKLQNTLYPGYSKAMMPKNGVDLSQDAMDWIKEKDLMPSLSGSPDDAQAAIAETIKEDAAPVDTYFEQNKDAIISDFTQNAQKNVEEAMNDFPLDKIKEKILGGNQAPEQAYVAVDGSKLDPETQSLIKNVIDMGGDPEKNLIGAVRKATPEDAVENTANLPQALTAVQDQLLGPGGIAAAKSFINKQIYRHSVEGSTTPTQAQASMFKAMNQALDDSLNNSLAKNPETEGAWTNFQRTWRNGQLLAEGLNKKANQGGVQSNSSTAMRTGIYNLLLGQPGNMVGMMAADVGGNILGKAAAKGMGNLAGAATTPLNAINKMGDYKVIGDNSLYNTMSRYLSKPGLDRASGIGAGELAGLTNPANDSNGGNMPGQSPSPPMQSPPDAASSMASNVQRSPDSGPTFDYSGTNYHDPAFALQDALHRQVMGQPIQTNGQSQGDGQSSLVSGGMRSNFSGGPQGPQQAGPIGLNSPAGNGYAAFLAHAANDGNPKMMGALYSGVVNQWNSDPTNVLINGEADPKNNPLFNQYLQGVLRNITNGDPNGRIDPERLGPYLFQDPRDQEQYRNGLLALQKVNQTLPGADKATGFFGIPNAIGTVMGSKSSIDRNGLESALQSLAVSGGKADPNQVHKSIETIMNAPFLSQRERHQDMLDLIDTFSPEAYKRLVQAGMVQR